MTEEQIDVDIVDREQREPREQTSHDDSSPCSRSDFTAENIENKLFVDIVNPIHTPPLYPPEITIKRSCYLSHSDWFKINNKLMKPGVYWHGIKHHKDGEAEDIDEWICSPLYIEAIASSPQDDNFGRLLRFLDTNGRWHEWAMPMHLLKSNGDELRGELLNQGVTFNPKKRYSINDYIMSQHVARRITAVDHIGWYHDTFVLPNQVIGDDNVIFQSEAILENEFQTKGTLAGWQQEIGKLCEGNIPLIVSISTALAGPLLKFIDRRQGSGIHWVGDSSSGKSTSVEIAASIWGSPEFIRSWSTTANGLEGIAATRNDTCLILDEIDEASPYEIGKITYMLANGQGKQRAGKVGNARKIQRWRIFTLSTGERTLQSIMNEIGRKPNAGQLVRLLNVPVSFEYGAFSNLHGFESGRLLADHLKAMRLKHYGHVGPAFIHKLMEDKRDFSKLLDKLVQAFTKKSNTNLEKRAATVFATVGLAGELAIEYGLLPLQPESSLQATLTAFQRYLVFNDASQSEDGQILQAISEFIAKFGDSRFSLHNGPEEKSIPNRAGWYLDNLEGRVYMFFPVALKEAASGFERSRIVEALQRAKWLISDINRAAKKTRTPAGMKYLYHIFEPEQS
ncbi:MAG: DUF927 domain-containing protein [Proteobacteria bacterium]|nr:DUF927 domain-containing protein [Pseudomonadota bacterium]